MKHGPGRWTQRIGVVLAVVLLGSVALMAPALAQGGTPAASPAAGQLAEIPTNPGSAQPGADPNATLTLNLGGEVSTADPQVLAYLNEIAVSSKVYTPLLALTEQDALASAGAASMDVSADGKTYTFKIRPGMTYSDGKPVTAGDYAYAIKRACSPIVNGDYSNILFAIVGCQDWRGADPEKDKAKLPELEKVVDGAIKAVDDSTLQIQLTQAAGYFPYVMTTWVTYPVRQDLVEGHGADWWQDPKNYIGNGPFKLVSHTTKQQWVFERNDNYFRGKPGIAKLVYKEITSSTQEFLAYQHNELDLAGVAADILPQVEGNATLKAQLHRQVGANTYWLGFNNADKPFDNVKVRQAIAYALNRDGYIKQVAHGVGQPADQFLYKGIPGYNPDTSITYDPAKAKQLLADAGYPDGKGFPKQLLRYVSDDPQSKQSATFWAQNLKQVLNIDIVPTPTDSATLQSLRTHRDPSLTFFTGNWFEDYPHPQDWLTLVFGPGSTRSPLGWNNQQFYDLVTKADALPIDQAKPLYEQAEALLNEQVPVAFTFHDEVLELISPNVKGYVTYPTEPFDLTFQAEKIYKTK